MTQFINGFVWGRHSSQGWIWVDNTIKSGWTSVQIGQFLILLSFYKETWKRAEALLNNKESEYWSRATVNPYHTKGDLNIAIDKLIENGRPNSAIECLSTFLQDKQPLDKNRTVQALLEATSSTETSHSMNAYNIVELIKALQDDPDTNSDDLFQIEWAYLPLLEKQ